MKIQMNQLLYLQRHILVQNNINELFICWQKLFQTQSKNLQNVYILLQNAWYYLTFVNLYKNFQEESKEWTECLTLLGGEEEFTKLLNDNKTDVKVGNFNSHGFIL